MCFIRFRIDSLVRFIQVYMHGLNLYASLHGFDIGLHESVNVIGLSRSHLGALSLSHNVSHKRNK